MNIQVCVGSSCHLKGSAEIVDLMMDEISKNVLDDVVSLSGSFCVGKCNRYGVTVIVDGEIHTGITVNNFHQFFKEKILDVIK